MLRLEPPDRVELAFGRALPPRPRRCRGGGRRPPRCARRRPRPARRGARARAGRRWRPAWCPGSGPTRRARRRGARRSRRRAASCPPRRGAPLRRRSGAGSTPSSAMKRPEPTSTRAPPTVARTPLPASASNRSGRASAAPRARARPGRGRSGAPSGASAAATSAQHLLAREARRRVQVRQLRPAARQRAGLVERDDRAFRSAPARRRRGGTARPFGRARPVPTRTETGVARPIAQGQAMMSTATPLTSAKASAGRGPKASHAATVSSASAEHRRHEPARHPVHRRAWIGSFDACAASTMRTMPASTVSAPTRGGANGERAGAVHRAADHARRPRACGRASARR